MLSVPLNSLEGAFNVLLALEVAFLLILRFLPSDSEDSWRNLWCPFKVLPLMLLLLWFILVLLLRLWLGDVLLMLVRIGISLL